LLDYAKSARPIVATDNTANRQILDEACAVFTAERGDALAAGVLSLSRDRSKREALGRSARRLIDEKHNFDVFKQGLKACYAPLLSDR